MILKDEDAYKAISAPNVGQWSSQIVGTFRINIGGPKAFDYSEVRVWKVENHPL